MRTAAKIFTIIGMILNILIAFMKCMFTVPFFIAATICITTGIVAIVKLDDEFEKPSVATSVCTLIFCSLIAGIIMLCIPQERVYLITKRRPNPQCEKCGKHDVSVGYYTVQTALGRMNRAFCPECKEKFDREQSQRHQNR